MIVLCCVIIVFFEKRRERGGMVFLLRGESRDVLFSENIYGLALDVELL